MKDLQCPVTETRLATVCSIFISRNYSVVSHVARGGAEMDDGCSGGAAVCEGVDVRHDIVSELALLLRRHGEINIVLVALHLLDLAVGDWQAQSLRTTVYKRAKVTRGGNCRCES